MWATPRTRCSRPPSSAASRTAALAACSWISDAHAGLKASIARVLQGAAWQRCRVPSDAQPARDRAQVPKGQGEMVLRSCARSFSRPIARPPERGYGRSWPASRTASPRPPRCSLRPSTTSLPTPRFPGPHWRKLWSTNPLSVSRSEGPAVGGGCVPGGRLVGAVLAEVHDDWQVADRRYLSRAPWPHSPPQPPKRSTPPTPTNFRPHKLPKSLSLRVTPELPPLRRTSPTPAGPGSRRGIR
jgi:putative transposase